MCWLMPITKSVKTFTNIKSMNTWCIFVNVCVYVKQSRVYSVNYRAASKNESKT